MALTTMTINVNGVDEYERDRFNEFCAAAGMDASTAINVFARAVVRQRRIPFEIASPETEITRDGAMQAFRSLRTQAKSNDVSDMPLDEINEEISQARISGGAE